MSKYIVQTAAAALLLASVGLVGCSQSTKTYTNRQLGYAVTMPIDWTFVENTSPEQEGDTVQFHAPIPPDIQGVVLVDEDERGVDRVSVQVTKGKRARDALRDTKLLPGSEFKTYEYGDNGYLVEYRWIRLLSPTWIDWRVTYHIDHDGRLYTVTFKKKSTRKKVYVSIDGYGKVN